MEQKTILVADDSEEIRDILKMLLEGDGYAVRLAASGAEAEAMADEGTELFILDVNMPDKNGFSVCAEIRKKSLAPVLFLTARTQESDMAMGFSSGGDDYLTKPFSNSQLLIRVKALLRRCGSYNAAPKKPASKQLVMGKLTVDTETQRVAFEGKSVQLTHTEYKILELMACNRTKIFSLENLYSSIWGEEAAAVGNNSIMVHVKNLRKKLGDGGALIKTAWGKGYYID